ncbi:MAG: M61 family metallopeptidase [Mucilaginibacter polytrichastri]|nr:M61 family metallopeptidase [Mucilaginibacter polytrichastri]
MRVSAFFTLFFLTLQVSAQQDTIRYMVAFPNFLHHEAEMSMSTGNLPSGPLKVRMSRSSPGRYATAEFGKNIYNVKAVDEKGKPVAINQVEGDVYEIPAHGRSLTISYTLFGNWTDGTYASIDASHVHLNMPAAFMWMYGMEKRPVFVRIDGAEKHGWTIATQLKKQGENSFSAPDLDYFMDSPIEISTLKTTSWTVRNPDGKRQAIHYTTHAPDAQNVVDNYGKMVQKVVLEQQAVFGELPAFDYGEYRFMQDVYPGNSGDGMEHRNSTSISDRNPQIAGEENDMLGTFSHEFFHCWNVERIRPKSLEPFDFSHANLSSELWFAEGFTQYYGSVTLVRAGYYSIERYAGDLTSILNQALQTPGAQRYSPAQMSRYAVFGDDAAAIDQTNSENIFTSYYLYGAATALALDLRLRDEFGLTLDDFMREIWKTYGKTGIPYTIPDLEKGLGRVTKNPEFAADFFRRYVYGIEKNDYAKLLDKAGFTMQKARPGKAWLHDLHTLQQNLYLASPVMRNTPLYASGIDAGDQITAVEGKTVSSPDELRSVLDGKKPGDEISISYTNRTGKHETKARLTEDPSLLVLPREKNGGEISSAQKDFRNKWLSSQVR